MHAEIANPKLVLLIPLTPEEERKWRYLEDHLSDPQWDLREAGHDWAVDYATVGVAPIALRAAIHDVVCALYQALDTVRQEEADAYAEAMRGWDVLDTSHD